LEDANKFGVNVGVFGGVLILPFFLGEVITYLGMLKLQMLCSCAQKLYFVCAQILFLYLKTFCPNPWANILYTIVHVSLGGMIYILT
jgi:hypothetical protein